MCDGPSIYGTICCIPTDHTARVVKAHKKELEKARSKKDDAPEGHVQDEKRVWQAIAATAFEDIGRVIVPERMRRSGYEPLLCANFRRHKE